MTAQGRRRLLVVALAEADGDLVCDVAEATTSLYARLTVVGLLRAGLTVRSRSSPGVA